jgi:hypothetical protein
MLAADVDSMVLNGFLVALTGLAAALALYVRSLVGKVADVKTDTQQVVDKLPVNGDLIASTADVNGTAIDAQHLADDAQHRSGLAGLADRTGISVGRLEDAYVRGGGRPAPPLADPHERELRIPPMTEAQLKEGTRDWIDPVRAEPVALAPAAAGTGARLDLEWGLWVDEYGNVVSVEEARVLVGNSPYGQALTSLLPDSSLGREWLQAQLDRARQAPPPVEEHPDPAFWDREHDDNAPRRPDGG